MEQTKKKILLTLATYHPPLLPPLGLSCLKSFLESHGYIVTIADANSSEELRKYNFQYFDTLKEHIPAEKQGNFYNIGNEVLRNHMMAYINYTDETGYRELIKNIIAKIFSCPVTLELIQQLTIILKEYYAQLKEFFLHLLEKEKPGVVGLSVYKVTLPSSLFLFKLAKETYPGVMTVMGGGVFADQLALGSPDLAYFAENTPYIDKILIGEGEILFLKLLNGELPANKKIFSLQDIQPHYIDISTVKVPDYSGLEVGYYPYLSYYTSRSCPFQCSFCGETVIWGKYRKKGREQIVREMKELYEKYNHPLFLMCDSLLNPTAEIIAAGLSENNLPLYWDGYLRVDKPVCDRSNTMRWRKGGYYRARLGVESGSQRILDLMH
ncbi:MAG: radical SAM protein, partial [Acidobacteria bacterium]|nr:radical SAM protein [Acidobacteriota bacterium]